MVMGMLAPPPKAIRVLPPLEGAGGAELGLALFAAAEDTVVKSSVGAGEHLDLAHPTVGLGIEVGQDHQVDRDQGLGRLGLGLPGVWHDVGNHGHGAHGDVLDGRTVPLSHFKHPQRDVLVTEDSGKPCLAESERPPTFSSFTLRSLPGS